MPRTLLLRTLFATALAAAFLASCTIFDKPEAIPAYVKVSGFTLSDTFGNPVYDQDITEVWAFLDGKYVGTFGLPVPEPGIPVPVAEGQNNQLKLYAGIKADRIEQQRVQYPFYSPDSVDGLVAGQTYTINLNGTAKARVSKLMMNSFIERFESGSTFTASNGSELERLRHSATTDVAQAPGGGEFYIQNRYQGLDTAGEYLDILQTVPMPMPTVRRELYLECQYRSTLPMAVGIRATRANGSLTPKRLQQLVLNPSPTWKKLYVYLYDEVSSANSAPDSFDQIQILFSSGLAKNSSDFIAVDNVRLSEYKP